MKKLSKVLVLVLSAIMVLAMSASVFAQTVPENATVDNTKAKITITNAANGETYKIAKLFDATVSKTTDASGKSTSIAYTGEIPAALSAYFTKDDAGNISATDALDLSNTNVQSALKTWAEANVTAQAVSDGTALDFVNLPFGYYVVTTTQGETLLTVDSTNPNAEVIDKNTTDVVKDLTKSADETDVYIGQEVTYTIKFKTANYYTPEKAEGATEEPAPEQVVEYTITDTPAADSLTNIEVQSIIVDEDGDTSTTDDQTPLTLQQFVQNKITVDWVDDAGKSLYKNGATLVITYKGTVADTAAVDGAGNKNTVEVTPKTEKETVPPTKYTDDETIFTYAIAIKKVDQSGGALAGATFEFPFYVKETAAADGAYIYAGTEAGTDLTNSLTTPDDGLIIVKGVKSGSYSVTETAAPAGYNKLTAPETVIATKTGETTTSTTTYLDADGNIVSQETTGGSTVVVSIDELAASPIVVVNKTGTELPGTGGIGTTIFYVLGSLLVVGCGIVLISRKRMQNNK